jgi:hypothetical protein
MRISLLTALLFTLALPALADDSFSTTEPAPTADSAAPDETTAVTILPTGTVYLMGRIQRAGTELDQAVFWQDHMVSSVEQCEKVRKDGTTTGWTAFHPFLRTVKGMSYKVDYRCVKADQKLSIYRAGSHFESFYLIRTDDSRLRLQPFNSFFACHDFMVAHGMQTSINNYCAATSQRLVSKKRVDDGNPN